MKFNIPEELAKSSGIYIITNTVNNRFYIGSSVNLRNRFSRHKKALIDKKHGNCHIQNFANKYGMNTLNFYLLETCPSESLIEREQFYLDKLNAVKKGFNICPTAGIVIGPRKHFEKPCEYCNSLFLRTAHPYQKYCSRSCGMKARRANGYTSIRVHTLESRLKLLMLNKARKGILKLSQKVCLCGKVFQPPKSRTKYCSKSCSSKNRVLTPEARLKISLAFKDKPSNRKGIFKVLDLNCLQCGKLFHPDKTTSKYCSRLCYLKSGIARKNPVNLLKNVPNYTKPNQKPAA